MAPSNLNVYSQDTLPLLEEDLLQQMLQIVEFGVKAEQIPKERLNGTADLVAREYKRANTAANLLAKSNMRLAFKVMRPYRSDIAKDGELWDDMAQEAFLAMRRAAFKYDLHHPKAAKYQTYAMNDVRAAAKKEFDEQKKKKKKKDDPTIVSLDSQLSASSDTSGFNLLDVIEDPVSASKLEDSFDRMDISGFLLKLPGRERQAMSLYFEVEQGSHEGKKRSYQEVGDMMGVSSETARGIVEDAKARLIHYIKASEHGFSSAPDWDDIDLGFEVPKVLIDQVLPF